MEWHISDMQIFTAQQLSSFDFYNSAWAFYNNKKKGGSINACDGWANPHWKYTMQCCETIHYGSHCEDWLLISPFALAPPCPLQTLAPAPPASASLPNPHGWTLHGSHVVGTRVWGTDGNVGAKQSAVCVNYRAKGACSEAVSAGDSTGGHMPLFSSLLSLSLPPHPSVRGH